MSLLEILSSSQPWMERANCKNMDTNIFFPEKGDVLSDFAYEVCNTCEVQKECFWYANETHSTDGLFGGMTPRKRQRWRSKNKVELGMSEQQWRDSKERNLMRRTMERNQ